MTRSDGAVDGRRAVVSTPAPPLPDLSATDGVRHRIRPRTALSSFVYWRPLCIALLLWTAIGPADVVMAARARNVLLFVVDTLRADRLGIYGNPRAASPSLDSLASDGVLFERAHAPAPQTAPSHASLFTSTYPAVHRVWNETPDVGRSVYPRLAEESETLAEVLEANGFATAAFADGGWVTAYRGFRQGFETFDSDTRGTASRIDAALAWLTARDRERPFFVFIHTYDVHAPYMPPRGYEDRFGEGYDGPVRRALEAARRHVEHKGTGNPLTTLQATFFKPLLDRLTPADRAFLLALYDAELLQVDEQIARLLHFLRLEGLLEETLVLVTADHGEEFGEHGSYGHLQVFGETIRIPLIVRAPDGARGVRRRDAIDLLDLMPSLLAYFGLPAPDHVQGQTIDLVAAHDRLFFTRPLVAEVNHPMPQIAVRRGATTVVFRGIEPGMVLRRRLDGSEQDVTASRRGRRVLTWARRIVARHRRESLRAAAAGRIASAVTPPVGPSPIQIEQLRALGYLD